LVLNRGKKGQEEKCLSSTGRAEKETKKRGEKQQNGSRNGKEVETMEVKSKKGEKPTGASVEGYMIGSPTIEQGWGKTTVAT
jgi:hypothetical protein